MLTSDNLDTAAKQAGIPTFEFSLAVQHLMTLCATSPGPYRPLYCEMAADAAAVSLSKSVKRALEMSHDAEPPELEEVDLEAEAHAVEESAPAGFWKEQVLSRINRIKESISA
jgi:hypothetical protein